MSTPLPTAAPVPDGTGPTPSPVMAMLSDHLPLTLLLDLALGVRSSEVYDAEPPDLSWLTGPVARTGQAS